MEREQRRLRLGVQSLERGGLGGALAPEALLLAERVAQPQLRGERRALGRQQRLQVRLALGRGGGGRGGGERERRGGGGAGGGAERALQRK